MSRNVLISREFYLKAPTLQYERAVIYQYTTNITSGLSFEVPVTSMSGVIEFLSATFSIDAGGLVLIRLQNPAFDVQQNLVTAHLYDDNGYVVAASSIFGVTSSVMRTAGVASTGEVTIALYNNTTTGKIWGGELVQLHFTVAPMQLS